MLRIIIFLILVLALYPVAPASGDDLAGALRRVDKDTDQLVSSVQFALQAQGQWPPAPNAPQMQLCNALQLFQQQVRSLAKRAGVPDASTQMATQQLLFSAQNMQGLISSVGNAMVNMKWMTLNNDLNTANALSIYLPPPPVVNNGGFQPAGSYPSLVNQVNMDTQTFVRRATAFFQATGRITPNSMGADGQFALALHSFQKQAQDLCRIAGSQTTPVIQQMQVQQLMASAQNVEMLLNQIAPPPDVSSSWLQLRGDLNVLAQSTYPVGAGASGYQPGTTPNGWFWGPGRYYY